MFINTDGEECQEAFEIIFDNLTAQSEFRDEWEAASERNDPS
jgi:hypothetical protein